MDRIISIVVPVYNVEAYLDQCIESVINQTYSKWELILVDDGSTDRSPEICDSYAAKDDRINVIHQKNAGVSKARNAGLKSVTGDFVLFCDSDDWMAEDALNILLNAQKRQNADLVFGDISHVYASRTDRVKVFNREFDLEGKEICQKLQATCIGYGYNPYPNKPYVVSGIGSVGNKLFKTEIIRCWNIEFDDYTNEIYEDNLFTISYLSRANSVCYKSEVVYYYRQTENSSIHRYRPESIATSRKIFERVSDFVNKQDDQELFQAAFQVLVIRRFSEELRVYYFNKENKNAKGESLRELKQMMKTWPYNEAVHKVSLKRLLPVHKFTVIAARTGSVYVMWAAYAVRAFIRDIVNNKQK